MPTVLTKEYLAGLAADAAKDAAKPVRAALAKIGADVDVIKEGIGVESLARRQQDARIEQLSKRQDQVQTRQENLLKRFTEHLQATEKALLAAEDKAKRERQQADKQLDHVNNAVKRAFDYLAQLENRLGK
jgi:vacuolar-type H+-ATPase subunit I/STV1